MFPYHRLVRPTLFTADEYGITNVRTHLRASKLTKAGEEGGGGGGGGGLGQRELTDGAGRSQKKTRFELEPKTHTSFQPAPALPSVSMDGLGVERLTGGVSEASRHLLAT